MGLNKDIRIFQFCDIHGHKFDACLAEAIEVNFRGNPQYSIVIPKEYAKNPGQCLYQHFSALVPSFPPLPPKYFYMKLDFKRHKLPDSEFFD